MTASSSSSWIEPQKLTRAALCLLITLWLPLQPACSRPAQNLPPGSYPMRLGSVEFTVELAVTPSEMATGLMHRAHLPKQHGMLFIYQDTGRRSFWMKNTHIPLDLGFFTKDGILREIHPLNPNDLTPVSSLRDDIALALEVNRGWFARHGLQPGAPLDLGLVRQALQNHSANN